MTKQERRDLLFMELTLQVAGLSSCVSKKVGCTIVKDGRPISQGYNGTPVGSDNCSKFYEVFTQANFPHNVFNKRYEIHAEMNAVLWLAKNGGSAEGCTAYVNVQPCWECSKNLIQAGIKRIVYLNEWEKMSDEERESQRFFLQTNGVELVKLNIKY